VRQSILALAIKDYSLMTLITLPGCSEVAFIEFLCIIKQARASWNICLNP
jgi:hypothetical protein